tara:strand:- start:799 stop:1284 length:486 start_codon:yes stop_codon:yes gene_type:complete
MTLNTGWTKKEEETLTHFWALGESASKIGAKLKRSRNSVISKVHRMGLKDHGPKIIRSPRKKPLKATKEPTKGIKEKVYYIPLVAGKPINKDHFKAADKKPVSLDELTTRSCRWPLDDKNGKHLGYCGANKEHGIAYCDEHAAIAYPALRDLKKQKQEEVA